MIVEDDLPLEEFVKLPTTVDFQTVITDSIMEFLEQRPYLRQGQRFDGGYMIVYTNERNIPELFRELGGNFQLYTPQILSPVDSVSNDTAGITRVLGQPFLDLTGQGVIIGIIDTGISYQQEAFRYEDNTTKILALWDQTIDGEREGVYFGSTYSREQINRALQSEQPLSVVPSIDEDGHGTFLASVAAGRTEDRLVGAAPGADLVCVKLRRAREYYIRRFLLPEEAPLLFESTDLMLGIQFVLDQAQRFRRSAVICIGMGSNTSAHDGSSILEEYLNSLSRRAGRACITAAGNEANARHHTQGLLTEGNEESIGIKVGRQGVSFGTLLFTPAFEKFSVEILSPLGESLERIEFRPGLEISKSLVLENTVIRLRFSRDSFNSVWVGLENATEGIWEIRLTGKEIIDGTYHAWLPITGQVDPSVEFLRPVPDHTIVFPGAAAGVVTVGAFSSYDGSLLVSSSWGPTLQPRIAPDLTAPGVRVGGYFPEGAGTMTGTSASAAVTAGAAALLMEWGVVKGNLPSLSGELLRNLLIGGAVREGSIRYPNNQWGYGKLNLYSTFEYIK